MRANRSKPALMRPAQADDAGYTLTEMLVVIAIIGLIAAFLTPSILTQMSRARAKAAQLQLETVAAAVELFKGDVGRYPTESEGLTVLVKPQEQLPGWTGPYLRDSKLLNDPWGHPLRYHFDSDRGAFYVESLGADGKPGGVGVDQDIRTPSAN